MKSMPRNQWAHKCVQLKTWHRYQPKLHARGYSSSSNRAGKPQQIQNYIMIINVVVDRVKSFKRENDINCLLWWNTCISIAPRCRVQLFWIRVCWHPCTRTNQTQQGLFILRHKQMCHMEPLHNFATSCSFKKIQSNVREDQFLVFPMQSKTGSEKPLHSA